jgi:hypothetical protein
MLVALLISSQSCFSSLEFAQAFAILCLAWAVLELFDVKAMINAFEASPVSKIIQESGTY